MSSQNDLQVNGTVVDLEPNRLYRVRLHGAGIVSAHVDSTLQMKLVRLIPGDQVVVRLSEVDPSRGRIVRRCSADEETER